MNATGYNCVCTRGGEGGGGGWVGNREREKEKRKREHTDEAKCRKISDKSIQSNRINTVSLVFIVHEGIQKQHNWIWFPFFALIALEETIVSVWNLTWNMTVGSISIRLQAQRRTAHIIRTGQRKMIQSMFTFLFSFSKLNALRDINTTTQHKHVSNTPVIITNISSFSIPLDYFYHSLIVTYPSLPLVFKRYTHCGNEYYVFSCQFGPILTTI